MRILLPTGRATADIVRQAASGIDADVVITGELASFLTPRQLTRYVRAGKYDMVIISGMCTASFKSVEEETGIPIYRGPRHAADLSLILNQQGITLSRDLPADDFLANLKKEEALSKLIRSEAIATAHFSIRGCKIGGGSRIKVLAEIMDAHRHPDIRKAVEHFFNEGADIVDLGFGFDAVPSDVSAVFSKLSGIDGPLAFDSQNPDLILCALKRADLILSLQDENLPIVGKAVADAGAAAVIIAGQKTLETNLSAAEGLGIRCIADPVLQPAGTGLVSSLEGFSKLPADTDIFFGAGNVIELIDADGIGMCALLAAMADEVNASVIFCSEHSDKTTGCVADMRRATEMMALKRGRPYPKDLGLSLFEIKEKRRRREPPLEYDEVINAVSACGDIIYDPIGNYRIGIEGRNIVAVKDNIAIKGENSGDVLNTIIETNGISRLDHAAYLGKELFKAELAIKFGRSFEQDGPF